MAAFPDCHPFRNRLRRVLCASAVFVTGASATACHDDPPPACRIAREATLPVGALGDFPHARLDRVGDGFILIAHDEDKAQFRFARVGLDGTLGPEAGLTLPARRTAGPWFGLTRKATPGDQLLVVYGAPVESAPNAVALFVVSTSFGATPAAPRPLTDPDGKPIVLPPSATANASEVAMGTAATGEHAVLAYGARATAVPSFYLLAGDGVATRAESPLPPPGLPDSPSWSCLAITSSRLAFGISRVLAPAKPDGRPIWTFTEFDPTGFAKTNFSFEVLTREMGCPAVAPTSRGYLFSWQNRVGTYFADVDTSRAGELYTTNIAKGAVWFGGPDQQPPLACVASVGGDFSLAFDAPTPMVEKFSLLGVRQGGTLSLPAVARRGPVSGLAQASATLLTYLAETAAGSSRRLFEITCGSSEAK